jgi:hypothetical protein
MFRNSLAKVPISEKKRIWLGLAIMEHQNTSSVGSVSGQHLARHIVSLPLDTVERAGREPSIETQTVQLTRYVHSAGERRTLSDKVCFKMGQHIMAVATPPTKAEVDEWGHKPQAFRSCQKLRMNLWQHGKNLLWCMLSFLQIARIRGRGSELQWWWRWWRRWKPGWPNEKDPHAKCFLECGINGVFQKVLESRVIIDLRW